IDLGHKLYVDARLSKDGTISCATCHAPEQGFSDGRPTSLGINHQPGARNAPTVINRLFSKEQFWDGRAADLEDQALGPIQNPIEMGHTLEGMISSVETIKGYAPEFQAAFGSPGINADRFARAIATYERTLLAVHARRRRDDAPGGRQLLRQGRFQEPVAVEGDQAAQPVRPGQGRPRRLPRGADRGGERRRQADPAAVGCPPASVTSSARR